MWRRPQQQWPRDAANNVLIILLKVNIKKWKWKKGKWKWKQGKESKDDADKGWKRIWKSESDQDTVNHSHLILLKANMKSESEKKNNLLLP